MRPPSRCCSCSVPRSASVGLRCSQPASALYCGCISRHAMRPRLPLQATQFLFEGQVQRAGQQVGGKSANVMVHNVRASVIDLLHGRPGYAVRDSREQARTPEGLDWEAWARWPSIRIPHRHHHKPHFTPRAGGRPMAAASLFKSLSRALRFPIDCLLKGYREPVENLSRACRGPIDSLSRAFRGLSRAY